MKDAFYFQPRLSDTIQKEGLAMVAGTRFIEWLKACDRDRMIKRSALLSGVHILKKLVPSRRSIGLPAAEGATVDMPRYLGLARIYSALEYVRYVP